MCALKTNVHLFRLEKPKPVTKYLCLFRKTEKAEWIKREAKRHETGKRGVAQFNPIRFEEIDNVKRRSHTDTHICIHNTQTHTRHDLQYTLITQHTVCYSIQMKRTHTQSLEYELTVRRCGFCCCCEIRKDYALFSVFRLLNCCSTNTRMEAAINLPTYEMLVVCVLTLVFDFSWVIAARYHAILVWIYLCCRLLCWGGVRF